MSVAFRTAGPSDAAALAELGARSFTETFGHLYTRENLDIFLATHSQERWQRELSDSAFAVRLGESDRQAVAYAKLGPPTLPFEPRGPSMELRQFYLSKPWQGRGVSQELMRWVIEEANSQGAEELYLSVFVDNHRARRFYARYGFKQVGRYDFMVGTHADHDLILRREL